MDLRILPFTIFGILTILGASACTPKATSAIDAVGTAVAQAASDLLTETAAASSPTPPPPTITLTPVSSETATREPGSSGPVQRPQTVNFTGCWRGPGPTYVLISNISKGKAVELLGIGSVPGWYVIRNPYFHNPCWVQAADLKIFHGTGLSTYPVMTPGP